MMEKLREKVKESLSSVLPITVIVLLLSILLIPMEVGAFSLFLAGAVFLIFGMASADSLSKNEIFYLLSVDAS